MKPAPLHQQGAHRLGSPYFVPPAEDEQQPRTFIDWRGSLVDVLERRARGEQPPTCETCGCELDVDPPPHSPRCASLKPAEASAPPQAKPPRKPAAEAAPGCEVCHAHGELYRVGGHQLCEAHVQAWSSL